MTTQDNPLDDDHDLALVRRYGQVMSLAAAILSAILVLGVLRRSFWALALPVLAVSACVLGGLFFIGRLLATTPRTRPDF